MDLRSEIEAGKLTLLEATELSRMLERWGVHATPVDDEGDLTRDFVLPLMHQYAAEALTSPEDHLAGVRAYLAKPVAH